MVAPSLFADSVAEASFYHSPSWKWFAVYSKADGQRACRAYQLETVLPRLEGKADTFISQASFHKPNRRLVNMATVGVTWVDCDLHAVKGSPYGDYAPKGAAAALVEHCDHVGLPAPSGVFFTGRGLVAKWYHDPIPRGALPRWNAVQSDLCKRLEPFGADPKAKDGSRVLRVLQTVNSKSNLPVIPVWEPSTRVVWRFEDLSANVLPYSREEIRRFQEERAQRMEAQRAKAGEAVSTRNTAGLRRFCAEQLWMDRLEDMRTLLRLRGWETDGVPPGHRQTWLFLGSVALTWALSPALLSAEVLQLAKEFTPTLPRSEVETATRQAVARVRSVCRGGQVEIREAASTVIMGGHRSDARYRFRNTTLVEMLEIAPEEQRQLLTLIDAAEAAERHRLRNRKEMDRTSYEARASERAALARSWKRSGFSVPAIAEALGVAVPTVYLYLAQKQDA